MTRRNADRPSRGTPGPVRLTVLAYALVVLAVFWLIGYGTFLVVTRADPVAWAGWPAAGLLAAAFGLGTWQLVADWNAETPPE